MPKLQYNPQPCGASNRADLREQSNKTTCDATCMLPVNVTQGAETLTAMITPAANLNRWMSCSINSTLAIPGLGDATLSHSVSTSIGCMCYTRRDDRDGSSEATTRPMAFPAVLAPKRNGSARLCVNYWYLNKVMAKDLCPFPSNDSITDSLGNTHVFTTLD